MIKITLIITLFLASFISQAEVLIIERIKNTQAIEVPNKGMSMNQVLLSYGEPTVKKSPVGKPPITIWKYSNFTVYFESSWVINSVINKANVNEIGPKGITQ